MALSEPHRPAEFCRLVLGSEPVDLRIVPSKLACKLRIRVSLEGVSVVVPADRNLHEAQQFVLAHEKWVLEQLRRVRSMQRLRRPTTTIQGQMLFRGELQTVRLIHNESWRGPNRVEQKSGEIAIMCGPRTNTPPVTSLENWLRREARQSIERHLALAVSRVKRSPGRVYIMDQRTKWGNCSSLGNLSFNWRLVLAPDHVLGYIVTHEVVHLSIPDHSAKFWLTVRSLYSPAERAREWLAANGRQLTVDLNTVTSVAGFRKNRSLRAATG